MATVVGKKIIILRSGETNHTPGRLPIFQGKGRAFGSGGHETTRSCLEQLEKINLTGDAKVLDVGCGSAVLAIAACRLGAQTVIALDPDPHAISTAHSNISLNGLEHSIRLFRGEISSLKDTKYSLIMANLYGDIILRIIEDLAARLKSDAILLLSGISFECIYDITKKAGTHNCDLIKALYLEEYATMLFRKMSDS